MKRIIAVLGSVMLVAAIAPGWPAQSMTDLAPAGPTIDSPRGSES